MHKYGRKDVYFNDGSIIKGAFEGFPRRRIGKVGTHGMRCCFSNISYIIYYTNILHRTIVHRKLAPKCSCASAIFDWLRDLMHKRGGRDVHHNDASIIRGAFEGFAGGGLEKLNTCCYIPIYYTMHFLTNCTVQGLNCMCGVCLWPLILYKLYV